MASTAPVTPALPWGHEPEDEVPDVPVGARVEVKWCLTLETVNAAGEGAAAEEEEQDAQPAAEQTGGPASESPPPAAEAAEHSSKAEVASKPEDKAEAAAADPQAGSEMTDSAQAEPEAEAQAGGKEDTVPGAPPQSNRKILWWGATVIAHEEQDGQKLAVLKYDAKEGFAEETRHVVFISKGYLMDGEDPMRWRLEGDESPESESEEEEEEEEDEGAGAGLQTVVQEDGSDVLQGTCLREAVTMCVNRLAERFQPQIESMTPFQQSFVLQGWEEYVSALRERAEAKGPDGVVEEEDIREITRELTNKRRRM